MFVIKAFPILINRYPLLSQVITYNIVLCWCLLMKIKILNGTTPSNALPSLNFTYVRDYLKLNPLDNSTGYRDCTRDVLKESAQRDILLEYNYYPGWFLYPR